MSAYDAIARDLSFGASGWVDEERLVGNVTAKQIIMLCRHVLDQTKHVKKLEAENAALRAQVPKVVKPVVSGHYSSGGDYHRCPECDTDLYLRMKYCHCGCKIDWSEVAP